MCPNAGKKCDCEDCQSAQAVEKARKEYLKWKTQMPPATDPIEERMFWVVTNRKTVEYLSCRKFDDRKWIVNRQGLDHGIYGIVGMTLFDCEGSATAKLMMDLEGDKQRLQAYMDLLAKRIALLGYNYTHSTAPRQ